MDYMMEFVGMRKLSAIKALRNVFDLRLAEAKAASESDGFLCTQLQSMAVIGEYLRGKRSVVIHANDWLIQKAPEQPIDFRRHSPRRPMQN